jgi:hypothetical protein
MPDTEIVTSLNDLLVDLNQSINVDYLALIGTDGKVRASAGNPGELNQADLDRLLNTYFNQPENLMTSEGVDEIRIIQQGTVECLVTPINNSVHLLALASIERPSVLVRTMLNELLDARKRIAVIVEREWKESPPKAMKEQKKTTTIKEAPKPADDSLETLIANPTTGAKGKDASRFWDNATLEDQGSVQNGQTISFDEARRSGLVPEDQK